MSVADPYLFAMLGWTGKLGIDLARWPHLAAFRERMEQRETVQTVLKGGGAGLSPARAKGRAMTQFDLTDDQRQIQEMAQKFTADAITPFAAEWDEKHIFPRDTICAAAELGFGSIYVSEESGGIGLGRLEAALIMEAMAYGCPSTSAFISIHNMAAG